MTLNIGQLADDIEPVQDAGFGALRTAQGNLPLRALDIHAAITAMIAGVEVTAEFTNPFDLPVEAIYVFPLPDRGAVTALRMEADGRVVEGVLSERGQARRDYEAAIAAGQRASLAEEDRPDVFTMSVGNIVPGESVIIRLSLTQPLPYEDGAITFRFPLVVAPRYIPGSPLPGMPAGTGTVPDTDAVPDASRITPPVLLPGFPSPVRLSITADIDPAGLRLSAIQSSLHAVAHESTDAGHTIVRVTPGERLNRDFILRLTVAEANEVTGSLVLCPDDPAAAEAAQPSAADPAEAAQPSAADPDGAGTGTFVLTLVPPAVVAGVAPRDVVIVLDRSGSMEGWKIVAARRAAARIVDTLGAGDRFSVLCFDNVVSEPPELAGDLAAGTDRNRFRAVEFLAGVTARGGTSMLPALERAVDLLGAAGAAAAPRQRALVLVTDGQVGNEDQIIGSLGPRLAGTRVHVVGIDRAVNAGFLTRLAAVGRGRCELVESEDRLDDAAAAIHQRIGAPLVTGLTMQADGLNVIAAMVAPARLPDLFTGAPVTISGRFDGACSPGAAITVRGVSADGTRYQQVLTGGTAGGRSATAIWARAHVRELEDSYACAGPGLTAEVERLEGQIVFASLRFGVLCRFTAFLAVDTRVVTDGGVPHRVSQPVELPGGWDMPVPGRQPALPVSVAPTGSVSRPAAPGSGSAPAGPIGAGASAGPGIQGGFGGVPLLGADGGAQVQEAGRSRRLRSKAIRRSPAQGPGMSSAAAGSPAAEARAPGAVAVIPDWARSQIADELTWLDAADGTPGAELARDLSDLGTRLTALVMWLSELGVEPSGLSSLRELAARLAFGAGPDGPSAPDLAGLRDDAREILRRFGGQPRDSHRDRGRGASPAAGPAAAASSPFWKRSRRGQ